MKSTFIALLALLCITGALGGRITAWGDIEVYNPNKGYVSYMDLYLTLDTKLPAGHLLRITLPFSIAPAISAVTVYSGAGSKGAFFATPASPNATSLTTASTFYRGSSSPFSTHVVFGADLQPLTNYVLRVTIGSNITDVGFLGYVQLETLSPATSITSTGSDLPISYDLNNAFAPVHIFAAPGSLTLTSTADNNAAVAGATSARQFKITPSQSFYYWPTIVLSWTSSSFGVTNLTSIDIGTNASALTPLTMATSATAAGQYSYTTSGTNLVIFHNALLTANTVVTYNVTVANPSTTASTSFTAMIYHRYNYNLTDVTGTAVSVSVTSTTTTTTSTTVAIINQQILLSWGIDRNSSTVTGSAALQKVFVVYATPSTNPQYQAINFVFGLNGTLSSSSLYKVSVGVCAAIANCDVLENSIYSNITGASCSLTYSTGLSVYCNVSALATSGNSIAARIWMAGTSGGGQTVLGTQAAGYSMNDTTFGTISITYSTTTTTNGVTTTTTTNAVSTSGQASSPYMSTTFNYQPLVNINGNGPLVALPVSGTPPSPATASRAYDLLWSTSGGASTYSAVVSNNASNTYTAWPTLPATTIAGGSVMGGIYTSTTAGLKYNVGLFTNAIMFASSATTFNTFSNAAGAGYDASAPKVLGVPGIDLFLNPNVFASAGSTTNQITQCFANNLAVRNPTNFWSGSTDTSGTVSYAHCYTNYVSGFYLRVRYMFSSKINTGIAATAAALAPKGIESTASLYMSFFWENAFIITNAYAGSSVRADSNVPDFYGIFYTLVFTTSPGGHPNITGPTTSATAADIGEISAITGLSSTALGMPIFWNQMLMGPYGSYAAAAKAAYYAEKSVFISNYDINAAEATYTSNYAVNYLRVRGFFSTSGNDAGLVPTGGRLALFFNIPNAETQFEGLGAVGFTTGSTANSYQTASTTVGTSMGTVPLVGNGAIRCWSNTGLGNCLLDRRGRPQPSAVATGLLAPIDLYEIITADPTYSANFSLVILIKPRITTNLNNFKYRLGFQASNLFYIQSWDQGFDNGATVAANGSVTAIATPFTAATIAGVPSSTVTGQTCVLPYAASSNAAPGVRLIPGATETDNTLLSAATTLGVNAAAAITATLKQGATTWCVQWNFKASSSFAITSNAVFESTTTGDKCQAFDYLSENATTYYCIYCPIAGTGPIPAQASATSPAQLSLSSFTTGTAVNILQFSFASIAYDNGALTDVSYCTVINGPGSSVNSTNPNVWLTNLITGVSSSGSAYNLTGQKVTFSFTAPSSLAYTIVDSITITGRTASTNTSDSNFPYGSLDSAAVCRIVPTASVTNVSAMFGCTAAISGGIITVTPTASAITSNYSTTTAWTIIIWGLNGNLSSSTSVTSTNFYVQTLKSSVLVDSSNTTNTSLAAYTLNTAAVLNFTTANVGYQRQIVGARGYFRFDFAFSSRNWFSGDKIVFNLDGIITTTANNNTSIVKCRITDTSDNVQQIFQSCTLVSSTTPATLTIYALPTSVASGAFDFSAANGYRVYLENMVTLTPQTVRVIWGNIYFNNGSSNAALTKANTGTDINSQNLTTAQTMSTPVITKYFAAANDYQDIAFLFTTAQAFSSAGRITIAFPSYYNPGLTSRNGGAYCTVNGVYTMCTTGSNVSSASVVGIRTIALYGYSGSVAAGGSLVVKIGGIRAPPASYTLEQFYVQINIDNSEALVNISSALAFNDTAYSAQTVVPLNVNWFTIGSTITRTTTTVTWTFGLNSTTTVSTTQAISAYFPEDWGLAWGYFSPTCTVVDATNASITYASAQTIFGNLVQLNVSTAIPNAAVVTLSCQNVRTPEADGNYLGNSDITIRVHDANGSTVYQRSAPGMHNVNFAYAFKSSLAYLSWNVSSTLASPASLTAGTYGLPLLLSVTSGASSNRTFTIVPSNANFGFISTAAPFYLTTGAVSNSSYLGCSSAVPVGVYGLTFTISDTTFYTTTPRLWVSVNNNAQPIAQSTTTMTTYYISGSTTSFAPLVFDTTAIPPYSDIVITPVAPTGNTNFTFTPAKITLTAGSPKNYFTFTTTSAVTAATASAVYTFTVTGTNAASYITPSAVTLGLTADTTSSNTGSPTLTVAADSTDTSAATSKILTLTLSGVTQATIYWAVTLQGQSITDATAIQSAAAALTQYNANSANQAQYGTFYQYASPSKTPSNFVVSGLYPSTGYTITVIAVSLANKTSTVASFTFVTGSNAASIQRWLFNYTTYPTQAQRQTLLCTITQQLAVPAVSVRNVNGEICGNTTSFYTTSNSTGDLGVYFYPLQVATDTVMPNLVATFNTTAKMNTLNTTISSGTSGLGFLNVVADVTVKNLAPSATFPSAATVGQTWANLGGISLNDTGFVFIAIGSNSTAAPTAVAFKQAAAGILSTTGLTNIQVLYYYPGGGSLSYNFTNLTAATTYNAYILASNNDPSFLQNFTSVSTVAFTTSSTGSTTGSPIGVVFSVMAIFASVISLLFL